MPAITPDVETERLLASICAIDINDSRLNTVRSSPELSSLQAAWIWPQKAETCLVCDKPLFYTITHGRGEDDPKLYFWRMRRWGFNEPDLLPTPNFMVVGRDHQYAIQLLFGFCSQTCHMNYLTNLQGDFGLPDDLRYNGFNTADFQDMIVIPHRVPLPSFHTEPEGEDCTHTLDHFWEPVAPWRGPIVLPP